MTCTLTVVCGGITMLVATDQKVALVNIPALIERYGYAAEITLSNFQGAI